MTVTPSPQSVETGVSPIYTAAYDSIRKGAPGLSDATCQVIARSINMKVGIAAAPAPTSLAGGEVDPLVQRLAYGYAIMHSAICNMAGTSGADGRWYYNKANEAFGRVSPIHSITEESNPHVNGDYFSGLSGFLAALSPEAPARKGVEPWKEGREEGRLAARPWRKGDPVPAVGTMVLVSGAHGDIESDQHRAFQWRRVIGYGVDGADFICLQNKGCWPTVERMENCWFAALTPRHEAPAEGAGERFTEGATLPDGAISGTDDGQTVWLESSTGGAHRLGIWGGLSLRFEEADGSSVVRDYEDVNLRARSSAPEAREGEAVGWTGSGSIDALKAGFAGHLWPRREAAHPVALFTHPAAPSADKLRDHLEWIETVLTDPVPGYTARIATAREYIDQALAALEAEGA